MRWSVWLTFAARDVAEKILAIIWPIAAFVLLGLEHSVANMFLLPMRYLAGASANLPAMAGNLLWVTLGNILGGASLSLCLPWGKAGLGFEQGQNFCC